MQIKTRTICKTLKFPRELLDEGEKFAVPNSAESVWLKISK